MFTSLFDPASRFGPIIYAVLFLLLAMLVGRAIAGITRGFLARADHARMDRTGVLFFGQLAQMVVYIIALVLYAKLIPQLREVGTALLAGVSVASIVFGLAAQNTLGNLVAGFAILFYHPIRVGDRVQVAAPPGPLTGTVESLNLGYTIIRMEDGRKIIVPNSTMANQTTINLNEARVEQT